MLTTEQRKRLARTLGTERKALGIPQKRLAKALGVSQMTISNYERGETVPTIQALNKMIVVIYGSDEMQTARTEATAARQACAPGS